MVVCYTTIFEANSSSSTKTILVLSVKSTSKIKVLLFVTQPPEILQHIAKLIPNLHPSLEARCPLAGVGEATSGV